VEIVRPLRFEGGALRVLDQTLLPGREVWLRLSTPGEVVDAIRRLAVRGAPAIGVAGAYAVALIPGDAEAVRRGAAAVAEARPTAANLRWAVERMLRRLESAPPAAPQASLLDEAHRIRDEDEASCRAIGRHGQALLPDPAVVLTHCNAGSLATAGYGTALGIVYAAVEAGKRVSVYADETRPLLQGARLTAYELQRAGIPCTVLVDSAAAALLRQRRIDAVIVGADRIAANGDVANKIGTFSLALAAREHGVPLFVAAPFSTVDLRTPEGSGIPIEHRSAAEFGASVLPEGVSVFAPAFDVTPARLVSALVTERGVLRPPYESALRTA